MMVFFLSIGLLIDLPFLWNHIGLVLLLWLFIAVFKSALNMGVLHMLGERWQVAFLSSVVLAQIGEFSFVLGAAAIDHAIINTDIHRLIVAVTVISLISSPIYLGSARRIHRHALHRIDSLSRLLRLVYFREWQITRMLTSRVVGATGRITKLGRRDKRKADGTANPDTAVPAVHPSTGDAALAPEPANDAELSADEPDTAASEAADSAELQPGKPSRRKGRGNRRSGPRTVGGAGGGGGGDT
jgi:CPA2 family monovalent cation:H+ antiporter-2